MMAELMGRQDGYCRGLGGSMHIAALDLNVLGCNGIVAAGLPIGTGAALATRLAKTDSVVIAFFGDGGANQGVVHEALNLAAVWKLPRSEEHTSELQSRENHVCRLLLEKKNKH